MATIKDLQKAYDEYDVETYDDAEEDRFEHITMYVYHLYQRWGSRANNNSV